MKNLEINTLNINSNSLLNIATFRQEDNATLMLELYKNGQSIDLTGQKIILGAERSDGSIIEQEEDISTNENIVTIKLKKNILAVNGLVKMQLTLSDREGTMSTTSFNINVDRKILGAENIKASNDIETINSLVLDLKTNVNKAITDTKDKASTLLSGLEDTANSVELKVNALTDISNGLLKNLENQCKDSTIINTELSNNIQQALPINTELKENIKIGQPLVQEAVSKNTELQASLEKTKEFINGLDGSQNIPQLRLDINELQNGLKSNQSLSYTGNSINANNTLEGRTEGMRIKGKTMYKKKDGTYTDTWEEGATLESFGEKEGNKISILSHGRNLLPNFDNWEKENVDGLTITNYSVFGTPTYGGFAMKYKVYLRADLTYSCKAMEWEGENSRIRIWDQDSKSVVHAQIQNKNGIRVTKDDYYYISIENNGKLTQMRIGKIMFTISPTVEDFVSYQSNKKDILLKEPLRENDIIYEDNEQVKLYRYSKEIIYNGNPEHTISIYNQNDTTICFRITQPFDCKIVAPLVSNNLPYGASTWKPEAKKEGICFDSSGWCHIRLLKSRLSSFSTEGFKKWLKENPTTVVYQLATPTIEIVENCVDIDLDTYQEKTYFNILNSLPGTLDFKVPSNIASIAQNTAREVNNIWDVINNLLVPSLIDINKNVAMSTIKNNLK